MVDIKRAMYVVLAASLLGNAATALASAASHPSTPGHGAMQRSAGERDGDKGKPDPREDQRDKGDRGDKGSKGDNGDKGHNGDKSHGGDNGDKGDNGDQRP